MKMDTDKAADAGHSGDRRIQHAANFLGGLYVNDFNVFGRTWQVLVQAEPEFRDRTLRTSTGSTCAATDGNMVPLGTLATVSATTGPDVVYRYNRFRAIQILGGPAPGYSSGEAVDGHGRGRGAPSLPAGFGYEWTGTTYQQKLAQGNEGAIFGFAARAGVPVPGRAV